MNRTIQNIAFYIIENYDSEIIKEKISQSIKLFGGFNKYFNNGDNILLKPNLLALDNPESGVITHPSFFEGVVKFFVDEIKKNNLNISLGCGDSPAISNPLKVAQDSGILKICKDYNIPFIEFKKNFVINKFDNIEKIKENKEIKILNYQNLNKNIIKNFDISEEILNFNKVVSLPKLKNHSLTVFTGGIKNLFGVIPGKIKAYYHTRFPDSILFSKMLVDLADILNNSICIMDGIIAHEGHGPRGGNPIKLGYLIIGENPFVVDLLSSTLVGYNPSEIPFLKYYSEKHNVSLDIFNENEYKIYGDKLIFRRDFNKIKVFKESAIPGNIKKGFIYNYIISSRPVFLRKNCTLCMECFNICPTNPKSIIVNRLKEKIKLEYNYNSCIRCFCCQEICPNKAIKIKNSLVSKILRKI